MEIGTYPLEKTSIFQGADAQQVQKMLGVILPSIKTYVRGETICRAGETVSSLGIVLAGGATIELCDAWGNRSIIGAEERDAFPADDEYLRQNDPRAAAVVSLPAGHPHGKQPVHDTV